MQHALTPPGAEWPTRARPAFGDVAGALAIVGAVGVALYRRATTGEPSVVDVSLLGAGMWQLALDIVDAGLAAREDAEGGASAAPAVPDRYATWNPLMLPYRTADGRFVSLTLLSADRHWPDLCRALGHPEVADDPRFADLDARRRNARACVGWLEGVFAERDLDAWRDALGGFAGEWAPVQTPADLHRDPQVAANGYLPEVDMATGATVPLVAAPAQFDGDPGHPERAPEHGEHTEAVLLELGLTWDEIAALKVRRAIL